MWTHKWHLIQFTLGVGDFRVKYVVKEHAEHLMSVLEEFYNLMEGWKGEKYIGLTPDWYCEKREVNLSMPGYVAKARKEFGHEMP